MAKIRQVKTIFHSIPTIEGAGVLLKRVFGFDNIPQFDPFLLLDHFGSDIPKDYLKGFPWHPHRGIETITYMINGEVEHGDNIGNKGVIKSGDIQWMTAGSGIIHQEMPKAYKGTSLGFQLWVNLPKKNKMTKPRYCAITQKELKILKEKGYSIKIISGTFGKKFGPVKDLFVEIEYFDVYLDGEFRHKTKNKTVFIYVYEGKIESGKNNIIKNQFALFDKKGDIILKGIGKFLFVSGNPLDESIAWGGPIVMNTDEELEIAFTELRNGTFIKDKYGVENDSCKRTKK